LGKVDTIIVQKANIKCNVCGKKKGFIYSDRMFSTSEKETVCD